MPDARRGFLYGLAAYASWGLFPLYFPLLEPAGALEILGHRIVWSVGVAGLLVLVLHRWPQFMAILRDRRAMGYLVAAAALVSLNWLTYIYGVNSGRVVETSLGYFINPLISMLLAVFVLGERMRRPQLAAAGVGLIAVTVLTVDYGRPPWIALVLALTFGSYGLMKKKAGVDAVESLAFETALLTPLALGYLVWLTAQGAAEFGANGWQHTLIFTTTGVVTAVPLMLFSAAAVRINLVTIGLMQYLTPILQFLIGVFWYGEHMPASRWIGFVLVWLALVIFTVDSLRHRRRSLREAAEAAAV